MNKCDFAPFQKVLVRDSDEKKWGLNMFSHYDKTAIKYPFMCLTGCFACCIPYEGNEHLLGTTNKPQPKRWRAKEGETYWFVNSNGVCYEVCDNSSEYDNGRYAVGNYFRTKVEAEAVLAQYKKLLISE